ncbi:glycerophosphodiester phosphodiesterase 1 isoform X1 [Oxyura jamaicensis]|uniref:glycerophosphodiester phosphodiesterase 1 isoform X1 n=2 Tax=Oxyura jamaicensis TaxID=8884 RepID=UPI0015A51A24|nr:glycerophosphodiester phosphodiesterase 1 isoform X1 [Oxyura jamaicensis]
MLCRGDGLLGSLTALLVALLALSRSPALSCLLPAGLYLLLHLCSLEPAAPQSAQRVLKPRGAAARIAHRGGAHDAPENTLAAIRQAAENGATGVELDLEFTADGVPILMHDETVERTTDGSGRLRDLTFDEIRKLNPSAKHRLWSKFQGEKVPTLREAVVESMHHNLTIYFDVKGHANQAVDALKQLYLEFPRLYNSSIVCSFMPDVVYKMKQADRNVVTALTHRPWHLSHLGNGTPRFDSFWKHYVYMMMDVILDWSLHSFLWRLCGVSAFLIQKNFVSQDYVRHWSSKGIQVVAWTVNTFAEKIYYENVLESSYITDSLVEDCDPHY